LEAFLVMIKIVKAPKKKRQCYMPITGILFQIIGYLIRSARFSVFTFN